jgi:hypothetical protein
MRAAVFFALFLAAGCGSKDKSGDPSSADSRTFWKHARGHFEKSADGTWAEVAPDGSHAFTETRRTSDTVELTDKVRNIVVTLHADHCVVKVGAYPPNRLYEGAWAARPGSAPAAPVADWPSDPALAGKLFDESDVNGYRVRPPAGYSMSTQTQGGTQSFIWQGPARADKSTPKFWVMVGKLGPTEQNAPLEQGMSVLLGPAKQKFTDYKQSAGERGRIGGLTFLRVSFSGKEAGPPAFTGQGVAYQAHDGGTYIHIKLMDNEPHHTESFPILEAAARTFRKP